MIPHRSIHKLITHSPLATHWPYDLKIVACVFVDTGTCLLSCLLRLAVSCHVTCSLLTAACPGGVPVTRVTAHTNGPLYCSSQASIFKSCWGGGGGGPQTRKPTFIFSLLLIFSNRQAFKRWFNLPAFIYLLFLLFGVNCMQSCHSHCTVLFIKVQDCSSGWHHLM
jgi:hypothetical protein